MSHSSIRILYCVRTRSHAGLIPIPQDSQPCRPENKTKDDVIIVLPLLLYILRYICGTELLLVLTSMNFLSIVDGSLQGTLSEKVVQPKPVIVT